jgi:hypothetical protein
MEFYQFTKEEFCTYGLSACLGVVSITIAAGKAIQNGSEDAISGIFDQKFMRDSMAFMRCAARQAGIKENL